MKYNELVSVSPGFKPSVNIKDDLSNDIKIRSYIPTRDKIDILLDISESLVKEGSRVRHFTGAVGTGKSNLGLVVANYYKFKIDDNGKLPISAVIDKIKNIDREKCNRLVENRNKIDGKFLVVTIEGYHKSINQALISELDRTLQISAGLEDTMPSTAYSAVDKLIDEWQKNHEHIFDKLKACIESSEYNSVNNFIDEINGYNEEALEYFQSIYYGLTGIERFYSHHAQQASDVYNAVSKELLQKGYKGILVIWDEFGSNLERLVADSDGTEYLELQKFAEKCNQLDQPHQIHLLLISHNSVKEMAGRSAAIQKQLDDKNSNLSKFEGRFAKVKRFSYDSEEIYHLIVNLIIKRDDFVNELINNYKSQIEVLSKDTFENGIFHSFTLEYLLDLTRKAIPLHPFALYTLIKICDKFAQNERSAFTYMCSNGIDTFLDFCNKEEINKEEINIENKLTLLLANHVFDYFYQDIKKGMNLSINNQYRDAFISFERAIDSGTNYTELQINILKALILVNLVGPYNLVPTANNLSYILNMNTDDEKESVRQELDKLCSGERKVLAFSKVHSSYRFVSLKYDLELSVKKRMRELDSNNKFEVLSYINKKKANLGISEFIESPEYRAKYKVGRKYIIKLINAEQLKNINSYENEIYKDYLDGIALIVLPETNSEIEVAKKLASNLVDNNQIVIGIPKRPIRYSEYIKELNTVEMIDDVEAILDSSEKIKYKEERDIYIEEVRGLIKRELQFIVDFKNQQEVYWYNNGVLNSINDLEVFIFRIMENTFNRMPIVNHKNLLSDEGSDGQKTYRISVIDKIFSLDSVRELGDEEESPVKTIINAVLWECNILKTNEFSRPLQDSNRNAFYVWGEIEEFITQAENYTSLYELFERLKRPPYGLKQRLIPIFFAAVLSRCVNNVYIKSDSRVNDIVDGTLIEEICSKPQNYSIRYSELSNEDHLIIDCLENVFREEINSTPLRIRNSVERVGKLCRAINDWWIQFPNITRNCDVISREALLFKVHILNNIEKVNDRKEFLLKGIKEIVTFPCTASNLQQILIRIKSEFENLLNKIKAQVYDSIIDILREFSHDAYKEDDSQKLFEMFYENLSEYQKKVMLPGNESKVREWLKKVTLNHGRKDSVLEIATRLTGIQIEDWQIKHLVEFSNLLKNAVKVLVNTQEQETLYEEDNANPTKSKVKLEINGNMRYANMPTKIDSFTMETKNLLEAMLDDVRLDREQEVFLLIKLLEERMK